MKDVRRSRDFGTGFIAGFIVLGTIAIIFVMISNNTYQNAINYQENRIIKLERELLKKSNENNSLKEYKKRYQDIKESYDNLYKSGQ